jgi:hypothetical protein
MAYTLAEYGTQSGDRTVLGDPIEDLVVAKVIAARRAIHSRCVTVVLEQRTGLEIARYDPKRAPTSTERRLRSVVDRSAEGSELPIPRKKLG